MRTPACIVAAVVLLLAPVLPADDLTLDAAGIKRLAKLVEADAEAKHLFKRIGHGADGALNDKPDPIRKIHSEGTLAKDPAHIRSRESLRDMAKISDLAWAWAVTSDAKYRDKCLEFLRDWAKENRSAGDPIDDTNLDDAVYAWDLLRPGASDADRKPIDHWLADLADAEKKTARSQQNNWHSHRIKIVGLVGYCLHDKGLIRWATDEYREQIRKNLHADGSSDDFHDRDALHYHTYDIAPLLQFAIAAKINGTDLYHYEAGGASLPKSVEFLVPFVEGRKTHAEFVKSKVPFDRKRADAGQAEYAAGHPWDPKGGAGVFVLDSFFDPDRAAKMLKKLGKDFEKYPAWDNVVHAARKGP